MRLIPPSIAYSSRLFPPYIYGKARDDNCRLLPYSLKLTLRQEDFLGHSSLKEELRSRNMKAECDMAQLSISQVARQASIRPSAIRYYERVGLLPQPQRRGGQRRYDHDVLPRLIIIQRARQLGFTLSEIRQLFFGFRDVARFGTLANPVRKKSYRVG